MESRSAPEDDHWDDAIPATLCEPSLSFTTTLGQGSNHSAKVLSETDHFSESIIKSHHVDSFRREIRIELLEIVDKLNGMDESHSLMEAEFEVRCTLEIFIAKYEEAPGGMKIRCGEDLCRDQQMGAIRTICDDFGYSTTRVMLPKPFLISAEDLFVKKWTKPMDNAQVQYYRLGMADQYMIKIWLEAPNSASRWPPLELELALDHNGRMIKWLREGTYSSDDIRLSCKGLLFPEGGGCNGFDMVLKLGGVQIQTKYALKLDMRYSVPPQARTQLDNRNLQGVESLGEYIQVAETRSPYLPITTRCSPKSRAVDVDMEDNEPAEYPSQKARKPPPLTVPETKRRLCDPVSKHILTPGEELHDIDDNLETHWRTAKHVEMIKDRPDISIDAKDYIMKWDLYVTPLRLSSNYYVPQALLRFVEENKAWFAEKPCRVREFSLHATSLRLRGSIDIKCFAKCVSLLQDCSRLNTTPEERPQETPAENAVGDAAGEEATKEEALKEVAVHEEEVNEEALDGGAISEDEMNAKAGNEDARDENEAGQNHSEQEVHGDRMNGNTVGDIQILTPERDATIESADEEATYEDTREDPESLTIDDFFNAEESGIVFQQPFYFRSCWQSITHRWPRLKLHSPENFGIATVLAAIAIFQGFPNDNIDRLIALYIHHCPNENIQDLIDMYYNAADIVPEVPGVCMTELKLHRIMWEASRETCEYWLTDVYRLEGGARRTVEEAIETATNADAWAELWVRIAQECSR